MTDAAVKTHLDYAFDHESQRPDAVCERPPGSVKTRSIGEQPRRNQRRIELDPAPLEPALIAIEPTFAR